MFTGVLISWGIDDRPREFFAFLFILATGVFGVFVALDLFMLFFFYEIAVFPMYLLIAIWGLRRPEKIEPPKPDPRWIKGLNHLFKWTLAGMLFSFHIANPPMIILGILVFLGGMICLATVRLHLTLHHVGNLLILVGGGTVVIAILLIPLGIAHVNGGEAAMAVIPGVALAILGFFLRLGRS